MVSYRNGVSIGEIVFYTPVLIIGVILSVVHGCGRNSGWISLVTFALVRIVGSCLQLATIHDPTSVDLHTWAAILQSIGLSPLMLTALGLLGRVIASISKIRRTFPSTRQLYLVYAPVTAALAQSIYGGIKAGDKLRSTGKYVPGIQSKIAVAFFILAYVLIVLAVYFTALTASHAERGEKRLLPAVALSLPFIAVRVVYSCLTTYDSSSKFFNQFDGNVTVWLVMGLIMEAIVVIIYETTGLTLRMFEKADDMAAQAAPPQVQLYQSPDQMEAQQPYEQSAYGRGGPTRGGGSFDEQSSEDSSLQRGMLLTSRRSFHLSERR